MSRSHRKPYTYHCRVGHGEMKEWRIICNRYIRRNHNEIPSGKYYKKINDCWNSPGDGRKTFWDTPKERRK